MAYCQVASLELVLVAGKAVEWAVELAVLSVAYSESKVIVRMVGNSVVRMEIVMAYEVVVLKVLLMAASKADFSDVRMAAKMV